MPKGTYYPETWTLLDTLQSVAPGPDLVEMNSNEILDIAGISGGKSNRNWFIYDLRRRGLAETGSPVNSGKKVKAIRLTEAGHKLIEIYRTEGEASAVDRMPPILGRTEKPKAEPVQLTRNQALVEARKTLGSEAPISDVILAAQFLLGE